MTSPTTICSDLARNVGTLPDGPAISEADIATAQKTWGDAVVAIGAAGDRAKEVAEKAAKAAYAFELGEIQFKPTLAAEQPFRPDLEGTLSYFVAGNSKYAEDKGFALKPWTKVRFVNDTIKKPKLELDKAQMIAQRQRNSSNSSIRASSSAVITSGRLAQLQS